MQRPSRKKRDDSVQKAMAGLDLGRSSEPFAVKTSKAMGRYLVASRDLSPGFVILDEAPLVVGPCSDSRIICLGCYCLLTKAPNGDIPRCPKCLEPLCSTACPGLNARHGHAPAECALLRQRNIAHASTDYDAAQALADVYRCVVPLRCLLLLQQPTAGGSSGGGSGGLGTMASLDEARMRSGAGQLWAANQRLVVDVIRRRWGLDQFTEEEVHRVCGILEINAFEISQNGVSLRALYPRAFLLAHACVPNTTHTDWPASFSPSPSSISHRLVVRACAAIRAGTPLTLSYAYTLQDSLRRRQHLLETKFFRCGCERCADPTELGSYAGAVRCPRCRTGLVLSTAPLDMEAVWACRHENSGQSCHYQTTANAIRKLMDKISDEVDALDPNDIPAHEAFLERHQRTLHPHNYQMLCVKHSLSQLYGKIEGFMIHEMSDALLQRKLDICQEILAVFDILEPGLSRLRGVTLYELHAPIMVLTTREYERGAIDRKELKQRLRRVVKCLKEAKKILGFEPEESSEGIMAAAATEALDRILDWQKIIGKL